MNAFGELGAGSAPSSAARPGCRPERLLRQAGTEFLSWSGTVYSGESPDIVCHEMGHAILDAIKPQLWGAASHEAAAFHESFGDMSAILSALQLQSLRTAILHDTGGHLYQSSRLSRLAEQLGTAIRAQHPDAVNPDCLRNAVNSFTYQDPINLPQMAPAVQLSSEPHSLSRVFTGACFEALAGMLAAKAADCSSPTEQELLAASQDMGDILVAGARQVPVVSNFYAQVAAAMVSGERRQEPRIPAHSQGRLRAAVDPVAASGDVGRGAAPIGCGGGDCPRSSDRPDRRLGYGCPDGRAVWSRPTAAGRVAIASPAILRSLGSRGCQLRGPSQLDHRRARLCR